MNKFNINKKNVLKTIEDAKNPPNFKTLLKIFLKSAKDRTTLKNTLLELLDEGKILKLKNRKYASVSLKQFKEIEGTIDLSRCGYGFLIPVDPMSEDIFVGGKGLNGAFHRDRVKVKVLPSYRKRPSKEGIVTEILKRGMRQITGRLAKKREGFFIFPTQDNLDLKIKLLNSQTETSLQEGDICAAKLDWTTYTGVEIHGELIKNFKKLGNPEDDNDFIILKNNLPTSFPERAIKEADSYFKKHNGTKNRKDLRCIPFITIDPHDAKDYDDAIYVEENKNGDFTAWISISDVSAYVREGSELDREALKRGNSYYFPGKVVPMLPPQLSNKLCSLSPESDKYAVTVKLLLTPELNVKETEFFESIIKNHYRATYDEVQEIIESKNSNDNVPNEIRTALSSLIKLSRRLFKKRMAEGGIDFDLPEAKYIYGDSGKILDIERAYRKESNQIVEELMLLANKIVASYILDSRSEQIYRIHEEPDIDKLKDFFERAKTFGFHRMTRNIRAATGLNSFLDSIKNSGRARTLRYLLLRSMKQAKYSPNNYGHYGLGFANYVHFTSPIRRYADLITHRILKKVLNGEKFRNKEKLIEIAEQCSQTERIASNCERDILKIKSVRFMEDKIGKVFTAYISGKTKAGFFIELKDHMVEGFCPLENILFRGVPKKRYRGRKREPFKYTIGDQVQVKLVQAVLEKLLLEFAIVS